MVQKILGLILARGGSKRVPGKNIKEFHGKPLIAWTIEAGIKSEIFDRFILSTDDKEIADTSRHYGVEVPFMRPAELASDTASSFDATKHAVEWLKENDGFKPDWIILLEPPTPGKQPFHIQEAAKIIEENKEIDSLIGITEMPAHFSPLKALVKNEDNTVARTDGTLLKDLIHRNQDVPTSYFINSIIYAFKTDNLYTEFNSLWNQNTYGYVVEEKYAFDIDTPEEWIIAEVKMGQLLKKIYSKKN